MKITHITFLYALLVAFFRVFRHSRRILQASVKGLNGTGGDREQCSIGFQPVPRGHSAWPCEIGSDVGVAQNRRSIGAGHRLEADATLLLGLVDRLGVSPWLARSLAIA
jgi:hypothetical protein